MKTMIKLFMVTIMAFLISCNNDDDLPNDNNSNTGYDQGATVSRDFTGTILDTSGNPVMGATVTIGSSTAQTNAKGMFAMQSVSVKERFAYAKVTKAGFINGSRTLVPTTGSNKINVMLIPKVPVSTINSGAISTVALPNGTQVKFDGSFKDENGHAYNGSINVAMHHLKPSDTYLQETMPGSLLAINSSSQAKVLETLGMMYVDLTGSSGQKLNIADGHTAEITMEIDATQLSSAPASIPLWSFDETTGMWKEDGTATKVGNNYVGNVSHFSWWNCDTPLDFCTLNVHLETNTGLPLSNVRIELIRNVNNWANQRTAITDGNGNATGLIPANEILTMVIYSSCGIFSTTTIGPFSSGSNNTLPTIVINNSGNVVISGTLQNCSGSNVTNGYVTLKNVNAANYFWLWQTVPITNGVFSFAYSACSSNIQFKLFGEDYDTQQVSNEITFTTTSPTTNVGIIQTCTSTNEYLSFKIDNNPTKTIITGISAGTAQGFYIQASNPTNNVGMYIGSSTIPTIGTTYSASSTFWAEFSDGILSGYVGSSSTTVANIQFIVSQIASVGGYIDLTMNGTYTDTTGTHTITCTAHVIRDN